MKDIRRSPETRANFELLESALGVSIGEDANTGGRGGASGSSASPFNCEASAERIKKAGAFWSVDLTLMVARPCVHSDHGPSDAASGASLGTTVSFGRRELGLTERLRWLRYDALVHQLRAG